MLKKLQAKTLVFSQIFGYLLTLIFGVSILLLTTQIYFDIKPLLTQQTDVFKDKSAIISKEISVFKSLKKDRIYFTENELNDLKNQSFIKSISTFNTASFEIKAHTRQSTDVPVFYTDLFFESIPDQFLDVESEDWKWDENLNFIPIIIPENYLNLYNFGFAESQQLPVLSKNTISQVEFNIRIIGNYKSKEFKSKIVGFSNKVNSILVPEDFLAWANENYGNKREKKTSRILVEFNDPTDKAILKYFNDNNYSINKDKLEFSKLTYFFKSSLLFVFIIAVIIVILCVSFIILSINLIIQKNKELLQHLYLIGYDYKTISKFYQVVVSVISVLGILFAVIVGTILRNQYLSKIENLFEFDFSTNYILIFGIVITLILLSLYNWIILRSVKRTVIPQKN